MWLVPINRELLDDAKANATHYNSFWYYHDYVSMLSDVIKASDGNHSITPY